MTDSQHPEHRAGPEPGQSFRSRLSGAGETLRRATRRRRSAKPTATGRTPVGRRRRRYIHLTVENTGPCPFDFRLRDGIVDYTPWTDGTSVGLRCTGLDGRAEVFVIRPIGPDGGRPRVLVENRTMAVPAAVPDAVPAEGPTAVGPASSCPAHAPRTDGGPVGA